MKLYEIGETYLSLINAIESGEIPTEAIADTLDGVKGELEDKVDNIACVIKSLEAEALAIKQEEENLKDRRSSKEKNIEYLKKYVADTMKNVGLEKLETSRNAIAFRKSKQFKVYDEEKFMNEYPQFVKVEEKRSIMKKEAKDAILRDKEILSFCEVVENKNLQIK